MPYVVYSGPKGKGKKQTTISTFSFIDYKDNAKRKRHQMTLNIDLKAIARSAVKKSVGNLVTSQSRTIRNVSCRKNYPQKKVLKKAP